MSLACEDGYMHLLVRECSELKGHASPNDGDIARIGTEHTRQCRQDDDRIVESVYMVILVVIQGFKGQGSATAGCSARRKLQQHSAIFGHASPQFNLQVSSYPATHSSCYM